MKRVRCFQQSYMRIAFKCDYSVETTEMLNNSSSGLLTMLKMLCNIYYCGYITFYCLLYQHNILVHACLLPYVNGGKILNTQYLAFLYGWG